MPSLRKLFNSHSLGKLALKVIATEALALTMSGCAINPPPEIHVPPPPSSPVVAKVEPYKGPPPVLANPVVPHVLGVDARGLSPWQTQAAYPNDNYFDKWYTLMGRYQMMLTNPTNRKIVDDFFAQFDSLKHRSTEEKAVAVEKAVNSYITYKSDSDQYEVGEYLATPLETIVTKGGDCEDYAILKYYTLRHLGVPAENMFMVFVPSGSQNHAILLVNTKGPGEEPEYLDLDNTENSLKRGKDIPYKAYYLINETGVWVTPESPWVKDPHKGVATYPQPKSP
jgi:predicted transglutaminase-like cysteine proteinase